MECRELTTEHHVTQCPVHRKFTAEDLMKIVSPVCAYTNDVMVEGAVPGKATRHGHIGASRCKPEQHGTPHIQGDTRRQRRGDKFSDSRPDNIQFYDVVNSPKLLFLVISVSSADTNEVLLLRICAKITETKYEITMVTRDR